MKKKKIVLPFLTLALSLPLFACGGGGNQGCEALSSPDDLVTRTPQTDALAFPYESDYATKDFNEPTSGIAYGKCTLVSVTDGDTCNFRTTSNTYIKCRFLGINTPESTAKVQPWGVKASKFCATQFEKATDFCLVNDIDAYKKADSSGNRNLAFVWYKLDGKWRLYNLECIEQSYSENYLFADSNLHYLSAFTAAGEKAKECGYRVNGAIDPDYDYTEDVVETTLYNVRHNYEDLGINASTGTSGKQLRVTALVVGIIGDNLILRDVVRDLNQSESDPYTCIYAYAGFNTSLGSAVSVGDVVKFYCRATKYPKDSTNVQLSDLKTSSYGKYKFEVLAHAGDAAWSNYVSSDNGVDPYVVNPTSLSSKEDLAALGGTFVQTEITVRYIQAGDYDDDGNFVPSGDSKFYNESTSSKGNCTIYAHIKGTNIVCNLRIDGSSYPLLKWKDFEPKKDDSGEYIKDDSGNVVMPSFRITGYLVPYYNNMQIQLLNNIKGAGYVVRTEN